MLLISNVKVSLKSINNFNFENLGPMMRSTKMSSNLKENHMM